MNATLRNVLVSSSLVLLMWTGCSGEDGGDTTSTGNQSSSTSGPTSTGTQGNSSSSATASSGGPTSSTGAGASGPGCDDIPPFPPGPSNGECIPGYEGGQGGAGVGGAGQGGAGVGGAGQGGAGVGGGNGWPQYAECNPVSQEGCDVAAGAECDIEQSGNFICFPSGNTEPPCATCNNGNGPWCQPGMHCNEGQCRRYCCDDSDCGPSLTCNKMVATFEDTPHVGLCLP
ncbi:MAG: hypothetical protein RIF41_25110 [Polyangiaceae bacterium]